MWRFRVTTVRDGGWFWELFDPAGTPCLRSPRSYRSLVHARAAAWLVRADIAAAPIAADGVIRSGTVS